MNQGLFRSPFLPTWLLQFSLQTGSGSPPGTNKEKMPQPIAALRTILGQVLIGSAESLLCSNGTPRG